MIYERKECQRAHALLHHALTVQPSNPALLYVYILVYIFVEHKYIYIYIYIGI